MFSPLPISSRDIRHICPLCQKKALSVTIAKDGQTTVHCFYGCSEDSQAELWRAYREGKPHTHRHEVKTPPRVANESVKALALKLWQSSQSGRDGLVPVYLASRGLVGLVPESLRGLPTCFHKPSGASYPAMIAAVTDWQGRIQAIHRTYLAKDGKGKAPVDPAKMTLGAVGGLAVHLAPAGERLAISEGIETGLSVQLATGIPTWAAISAGGMRTLILPALPLAREIVIAADNDAVGMKSAHDAATRWQREGRSVRIATPPEGKDFNDVLQEATI